MIIPASGPKKKVLLLPKELDEKVTKMHFSALGAELIVMSGEVGPTGTSPKRTVEQVVIVSVEMQAKSGAFDFRKYREPWRSHRASSSTESSRQHQVRSIRTVYIQTAQKTVEVFFQRQSSMIQKDGRDPPSAVHWKNC